MGFGISKQVTINDRHQTFARSGAIVFSKEDSESVLSFESPGTYLLYRDYDTDRLYLSVRSLNHVEHHRINFEDNLYYMDNQPYPYLDSIILYHSKHKLNGTKLTHHAHLSARTVKLFTTKVTAQNGNIPVSSDSRKPLYSSSFAGYDRNITGIEHTNDMVLTSNRITKSSGRLWRPGMHESFKRFSMPESVTIFRNLETEQSSHTGRANGHVPRLNHSSDDLDNDLDDLFDLGDQEGQDGGPDIGQWSPEGQGSPNLQRTPALSEPNIIYCSHL